MCLDERIDIVRKFMINGCIVTYLTERNKNEVITLYAELPKGAKQVVENTLSPRRMNECND